MQDAVEKLEQWTRFYERAQMLLRSGRRGLRRLSGPELARLIDDYQALTADLARARSLGAARETVDQLNRDSAARREGTQRTGDYGNYRSGSGTRSTGSYRGGGGMRAGGGRRR